MQVPTLLDPYWDAVPAKVTSQMFLLASSWQNQSVLNKSRKVTSLGNVFEQGTCPRCFLDSHLPQNHWPWDRRHPPTGSHQPTRSSTGPGDMSSTPCSFLWTDSATPVPLKTCPGFRSYPLKPGHCFWALWFTMHSLRPTQDTHRTSLQLALGPAKGWCSG